MTAAAARVIIVDDVEDMRSLLRTVLTVHGNFEVVGEAVDGHSAVALATEVEHDILVLDLGLPDLGGREVLDRIRVVSPATKVVVFSGVDSHDNSWIAEHVEGYAVKGASMRELVGLLEVVAQT